MKTKYIVVDNGRLVNINSKIAGFVSVLNYKRMVFSSRTINFVVFLQKSLDPVDFEAFNKMLYKHGLAYCSKCDNFHNRNYNFCPWCGRGIGVSATSPPVMDQYFMTDSEIHTARFIGKIPAIKEYRNRTGCDLLAAKHNIEGEMESLGYKFFGD